jgi:NAD(P)-dependent dehydrogenase (short-subunit alcohol dehydrogenase family)
MSDSNTKVVLISGASGGVGAGVALACASAGWTIWIMARRATEAQAVADQAASRGGSARVFIGDVSDPASVRTAVATVIDSDGRLDGIVHNATSGLSPIPTSLAEVPFDDVEDHVKVSVRGTYLLAAEGHAHLVAAQGSFVALTSEAGFEGKARLPVYAAVKAAQRGVIRSLAREWGPTGARANCVAPLASTPAMSAAFANDPAMATRVLARNPLARLGDAELDIGPVVRFLLSDESRYVNGMTVMADGGSCPIT